MSDNSGRAPAVIEVDEASFERDVIERSRKVPVVVDFWAEWCGPCRTLGPTLERLAQEAGGDWVLAKVDVDQNQYLAATFRVQGIPAVHAFRDGKKVAEFVGALPEPQVRSWLEQLKPSEADMAVLEGDAALDRGDAEAAAEAYRRALSLAPGHHAARSSLETVELHLRGSAIDEDELDRRLEADPADVDAAIGVADASALKGDLDRAFEVLLNAVRATTGDDREKARLHFLKLLETVPIDDPRALSARRALSMALF